MWLNILDKVTGKDTYFYFSGCLKQSGNVFSSPGFIIYSANLFFRVLNTIFF